MRPCLGLGQHIQVNNFVLKMLKGICENAVVKVLFEKKVPNQEFTMGKVDGKKEG